MRKPRTPKDVAEGESYVGGEQSRRVVSVRRMDRYHRHRTREGADARSRELKPAWIVSFSDGGNKVRHVLIDSWRAWVNKNKAQAWRQ